MKRMPALIAIAGALAMGSAPAAQPYPVKPVRLVVPFTAGSGTDIFARTVVPKLSDAWPNRIVIDNRAGAGGSIGASVVANSAPDGYTLLWTSNGFVSNSALLPKLPYNLLNDFVAITPAARQPFALVVGSGASVVNVSELVAKARSGLLTYASAGIGTATHFAAEEFRLAAGVSATHVPYKGGPEANGDVIAGRVTYWFAPLVMAASNVRDGKGRALAVTGRERSTLLPEVPTLEEAGLRGAEYFLWNGLWAPAGTPSVVVEKIASDVARALASTELRERLTTLGAEPLVMRPALFTPFVRSELEEAAKIAGAAGIRLD